MLFALVDIFTEDWGFEASTSSIYGCNYWVEEESQAQVERAFQIFYIPRLIKMLIIMF
jgi:hypothetical protein